MRKPVQNSLTANLDIQTLKKEMGRGPFDRVFDGRNLVACPFHDDSDPSMHLKEFSDGTWVATCFGACNNSWDAIAFTEKLDNLTFVDAVTKLSTSCFPAKPNPHGSEAAAERVKPPTEWPDGWKPLTPETYEKMCAWRKERSLLKGMPSYMPMLETFLRFDVRETNGYDGTPLVGFPYWVNGYLENAKVFAITVTQESVNGETLYHAATEEKDGKVVAMRKSWQGIKDTSRKPLLPNSQSVLFGFDLLTPHSDADVEYGFTFLKDVVRNSAGEEIEIPVAIADGRGAVPVSNVFIVEGEWDALCMYECGYSAVATLNAGQKEIDADILSVLSASDKLYLMPDGDEAGKKAAPVLLKVLPKQTVVVNVPEHLKDACTMFARYGRTGFIDAVDRLIADRPVVTGRVPTKDLGWPTPMGQSALHGLAGQVVERLWPEVESDKPSLLANFLSMAGVLFGREAWAQVGATRHYPFEFVTLIGASSRARKGTGTNLVMSVVEQVEEGFEKNRVLSGLSTGEGLIKALQEKDETTRNQGFLVKLGEFATLLEVMKRESNTMSAALRQAWDGERLRVLTRKEPLDAENVSLSVIAHITQPELLNKLTSTDRVNGFANRFLMLCTKRDKYLPHGGNVPNTSDLVVAIHKVVEAAKGRGVVRRNAEADELWSREYARLTDGGDGVKDALCARAEAHVLRLSLIYALLDSSAEIRSEHLRAAIDFWDYCERSVEYIFGGTTGDPDRDRIMVALTAAARPMSNSELHAIFGNNRSADWIAAKMASLKRAGLVATAKVEGKKKTVDGWAKV